MPTNSGKYNARSFFGAVHVITYRSLPPNRGLKEYVQIQIALARLLRNLFQHVRKQSGEEYRAEHVSSAVGLFVALPILPNCPCTVAALGFSLPGTHDRRRKMLNDRFRNLPCLRDVKCEKERWRVGNCAETELFAYMKYFTQFSNDAIKIWRTADNMNSKTPHTAGSESSFFVGLTYKMGPEVVEPAPFCGQCRELANLMSEKCSSLIVDLMAHPIVNRYSI